MATERTSRRGMGRILPALAILAIAAGCGHDDSTAASPKSSEIGLLKQAAAASSVVSGTVQISSDAIVDDGTGGGAPKGLRSSQASPTGVNFQASVNVTIDLDSTGPLGNDLFPNATGVITVSANGSIVGDEFAGTVSYDVNVSYDTDVTFTDPESGAQATVSAGASLSHTIVVDWNKTDEQNWTVNADTQATVANVNVVVIDDTKTVTASVDGYRHITATVTMTAGKLAASLSVDGYWDVTISDGTETHTVRVDVVSLAEIYFTVDGIKFGPFTVWQLKTLFGVTFE